MSEKAVMLSTEKWISPTLDSLYNITVLASHQQTGQGNQDWPATRFAVSTRRQQRNDRRNLVLKSQPMTERQILF